MVLRLLIISCFYVVGHFVAYKNLKQQKNPFF